MWLNPTHRKKRPTRPHKGVSRERSGNSDGKAAKVSSDSASSSAKASGNTAFFHCFNSRIARSTRKNIMPKIQYVAKHFRQATLDCIHNANVIIEEYLAQGFKLTLRQLYYQFVARDLLPNTQQSYKNLGGIINDGRLAGLIDWDAIEDRTRNMVKNPHWFHPNEIIETCAKQFRLNSWEDQKHYCEVWIEKEALAGILEKVCPELDVPYFSCRGYVSQSEMWAAGKRFCNAEGLRHERKTTILHLGDHDPSGIDMTRDIRERLNMFGSDVIVKRIALNMDQIEEYSPPPNPAKTTDARWLGYVQEFGGDSWELDALEPQVLMDLVRNEIEKLIDYDKYNAQLNQQDEFRDQLYDIGLRYDQVVEFLKGPQEKEE